MLELSVTIGNATGLHARPASMIVSDAKKFDCDITIHLGEKKANARSMVSILKLGAKKDAKIKICFEGPDKESAYDRFKELILNELSEEPVAPEKSSDHEYAKQSHHLKSSGKVLSGISASPGIISGRIFHWKQNDIENERPSAGVKEETNRLQSAIALAKEELKTLHDQVASQIGDTEANIFNAQIELLEDPEIEQIALSAIKEGKHAATAWRVAIDKKEEQLLQSDDSYLAARATDIRDIGKQVLRVLEGSDSQQILNEPAILIAEDLTPSETMRLNHDMLLGICTAKGSSMSHTAILSRALGIPAMVQMGSQLLELSQGERVILNSDEGELLVNPMPNLLLKADEIVQKQKLLRDELTKNAAKKAITKDGKTIGVVANIASIDDAEKAPQFGAEGIGLLRTELIFQNEDKPPTEDEQYEIYKKFVLSQKGNPVTIRTLDAGSDKPVKYLTVVREDNPALGQRGIRLSLEYQDIFITQVRAILRASIHGEVRIMFPMVTTIEEWHEAKKILDDASDELGISPIKAGMMIEVPAAAISSKCFADKVDFFSIGTNDLIQYTLAMDRMNYKLSSHLNTIHPAVIQLIYDTVKNSHEAGKKVCLCGEAASDTKIVPLLIGLGVDELSINIPSIPVIKNLIKHIKLEGSKELAGKALACSSYNEVWKLVSDFDAHNK